MLGLLLWHLVLATLTVWAMYVQFAYRIPGTRILLVLPWVGVALLAVEALAAVHAVVRRGPAEAAARARVRRFERIGEWAVLGFVIWSFGVFANGWLSRPVGMVASEVLEIAGTEMELSPWGRLSWAVLRSWRTPGGVERLLLWPGEERRLWGGQPVRLHLREGAFGAPWVTGVTADQERLMQQALAVSPTASLPWKWLALNYLHTNRSGDAKTTTLQYLALYPHDEEFALRIAYALFSLDLYKDVVSVLEPFLARRPSFDVCRLLGAAMTKAGRRPEGLDLLRRATVMEPTEWWPYFAIGYVHLSAGEFAEAITAFERVLERRPRFPQVEAELQRLRPLATTRQPPRAPR